MKEPLFCPVIRPSGHQCNAPIAFYEDGQLMVLYRHHSEPHEVIYPLTAAGVLSCPKPTVRMGRFKPQH